MKTTHLLSLLLSFVAGCGASSSTTLPINDAALTEKTPATPIVSIAQSVEADEEITPISADFPDINDPSSAPFYENHANYKFKRDSEDRRSDLGVAYRAAAIAAKLYRASGRSEEYERTSELKQQIIAEQKAAGYR